MQRRYRSEISPRCLILMMAYYLSAARHEAQHLFMGASVMTHNIAYRQAPSQFLILSILRAGVLLHHFIITIAVRRAPPPADDMSMPSMP